jgi:hypothetical protein
MQRRTNPASPLVRLAVTTPPNRGHAALMPRWVGSVGEPIWHVCRDCGAEEKNHTGGRCARCSLAEVLRRLRADGDLAAIARLERYLTALGSGSQPATTLKWMGYSAGYETVVELAIGARELSHQALDEVRRGMTTSFLRAALVTHGVLESRPEQTSKSERAARATVRALPAGEDRSQVRAFALWHVQYGLVRRERRGRTGEKSAQSSLRSVRAAAELSTWAAAEGLTLSQLRQEHLDFWLQNGSSATASIGPFLKWAARGGLMAPLGAERRSARTHVEPISNGERLRVVRRLLHDERLDLRDRVAGLLILIYAQPLTKVLGLKVEHVTSVGDRVLLRLGRDPLELPEPLDQFTTTLARKPTCRATTAVAGADPPWLFQEMRVVQPMSHSRASRRLRRLGIRTLEGRTSAIVTLAAALPPTILAELLGISETSASKWYRLAGGEWGRYAASSVQATAVVT